MHANRGMYAEEIVNRTIDYYLNNNVCLIEKRNIPIKIVKIINDNMIVGKLLSKSTVDYCGFINNNHFEFEVKQTNNQNFTIDLIKQHQYEYLRRAYLLRSLSFLIVHFSWCDEFYLLPFKWIDDYVKAHNTKTIKYLDIKNESYQLLITYPGILNLKETILKLKVLDV